METIGIKEVPMIDVKIHKESLEKDERRYAYEKAIEAYWNHVDRYHTWMNYYAIFNGALFVGFCTLLTATTKISTENYLCYSLSNDYKPVYIVLSILGLISSMSWYLSIKGHEKWERSWMSIIEKYEFKDVYRLIIAEKSDIVMEGIVPHYFKAYSTHKITKLFVASVIISWGICPLLLFIGELIIKDSYTASYFIIIAIEGYYIFLVALHCIERISIYSNIKGKKVEFK